MYKNRGITFYRGSLYNIEILSIIVHFIYLGDNTFQLGLQIRIWKIYKAF